MIPRNALRSFVALVALAAGAAACSSDKDASDTTAPATTAVTATTEASTTDAPATSAAETTDAPTTDVDTTSPPETVVEDTDAPTTDSPTTDSPTTDEPTTSTEPEVLEILVTNDDGYAAPGLDEVVKFLTSGPGAHVSVWAPLENQSGSSAKTSDTPPPVTDVTTASGYPAKAVAGFPADAVYAALASGATFDLVISGNNAGQNYGPFSAVSGTVGAAATAAQAGIPAIALSQGFPADGVSFQYTAGVAVLSDYLFEHMDEYEAGTAPELVSINVPTCPPGTTLGSIVEDLPSAIDMGDRPALAPTACDGNPAEQVDDVDAFNAGHPTVTVIDPTTLLGVQPTP